MPLFSELDPIQGHNIAMSTHHLGLLAYTDPASEKRLVIKPGRYLRRFYPGLSDPDVARLVATLPTDDTVEFRIARTEDEIVLVYANGPHSCMSHSDAVKVYAGPDTGVGYLLRPGSRITARAVLRLEGPSKGYIRIYGDTHRMLPELSKHGFDKQGSLLGARLLHIGTSRYPRAPYVDGLYHYAKIDNYNGHLVVDPEGDWCIQNTGGYAQPSPLPTCWKCHTNKAPRGDEHRYCTSCYNRETQVVVERNEIIDRTDAIQVNDGYYMPVWVRKGMHYQCDGNKRVFADSVPSYQVDGRQYSEPYLRRSKKYGYCEQTGRYLPIGQLTRLFDGYFSNPPPILPLSELELPREQWRRHHSWPTWYTRTDEDGIHWRIYPDVITRITCAYGLRVSLREAPHGKLYQLDRHSYVFHAPEQEQNP
jgi:hypothetical protein